MNAPIDRRNINQQQQTPAQNEIGKSPRFDALQANYIASSANSAVPEFESLPPDMKSEGLGGAAFPPAGRSSAAAGRGDARYQHERRAVRG